MLQLMTEKGNHIKVRRQLEQVTSEHGQLLAESSQLRDAVAKLTAESESFSVRELELKMAADRLGAEQRAAAVDRDRLNRELEDRRARDMAVQDNIEVCIVGRWLPTVTRLVESTVQITVLQPENKMRLYARHG